MINLNERYVKERYENNNLKKKLKKYKRENDRLYMDNEKLKYLNY